MTPILLAFLAFGAFQAFTPNALATPGGAFQNLPPESQDALAWTLAMAGSDNDMEGGIVAGGGELIRQPGGPSVLIDFWHFDRAFRDQSADGEMLPAAGTPSAKNLFYGEPIGVEQLPESVALLRARLKLWKNNSPLTVEMIENALQNANFRVTDLPFQCTGRGSPDPAGNQDFPNIVENAESESVGCFLARKGIYLQRERFHSLGRLSRAGLLAHELLRKIQSEFDLGFADSTLLRAVNLLMRREPGRESLDHILFSAPWKKAAWSGDNVEFASTLFCLEGGGASERINHALVNSFLKFYASAISSSNLPEQAPAASSSACRALENRKVIDRAACAKIVTEWSVDEQKGALDTAIVGRKLPPTESSRPAWISSANEISTLVGNKVVARKILDDVKAAVASGYCARTIRRSGPNGAYYAVPGERRFVRQLQLLHTLLLQSAGINPKMVEPRWALASLRWPEDPAFNERYGGLYGDYEDIWARDRELYLKGTNEGIHQIKQLIRSHLP